MKKKMKPLILILAVLAIICQAMPGMTPRQVKAETTATEENTATPTPEPIAEPLPKPADTAEPTKEPTQEPTQELTQEPARQEAPLAPTVSDAAESSPASSASAEASAAPSASPSATPVPVSALSEDGSYKMVADDLQTPLTEIKEGEFANLIFFFRDSGLTKDHLPDGADSISVSLPSGSFELVENSRDNPDHTGRPKVIVTSAEGQPLTFTVIFPHARYSGAKADVDFSLSYRGGIQGSLRVRYSDMRECATPTPTVIPSPTDTPAPTDNSASMPTDTPAPTDNSASMPTEQPVTTPTSKPTDSPTIRPASKPSSQPESPDSTPEPVPAPVVHISRGEMPPIRAGEPFTVEVLFTNFGKHAVQIPVATFTPSEGISLDERTPSFMLERIEPGAAYSMRLHLKAARELSAAQYTVDVALKFEYAPEGGQPSQGSAADKLLIPAFVPEKKNILAGLLIGRTDFLQPITSGQSAVLTLWFKNTGNVALERPIASFSTSEALMLLEATTSSPLPDIAPGETAALQLRIRANKEIPSPQQHVQVEVKYDYRQENGQIQQGSAAEKVLVPAVVKARSSGGGGSKKPAPEKPVPNLIISRYDFGAGQVAAGAEFPLNITFKNTNALRGVENIVMTLETSEGLTITSSSNTAFFTSLAPGEEKSVQVRMMALPAAKTEPARVDVGFKYEYLDPEKRSSATVTEKIFVPIYQPDRMILSAPTGPENAEVGKETIISIPYVNKGKSEVSNLSAVLSGKVKALTRVINAGNIESGKSGSLDFILTPDKEGVEQFTIKVTYEDASAKPIAQEFPLSISVAAPYEEPPMEGQDTGTNTPEPPETTGGDNNRLIIYGLGGLWAATVTGSLVSRHRRKRKMRDQEALFKFEDDLPGGKA